ncbi:MAG: hypothetical protein GY786_22755, partial [Proteobacteria bacterium]|nr:hypothetical protein [Pseudomonadota bacterium]
MRVKENYIVTISYSIYDLEEKLLYSSVETGDLVFRQNSGAVMKGIEEAVEDRSP